MPTKPIPEFTDEEKAKVRAFLDVLNDHELGELSDLYPQTTGGPQRRLRPLILAEISLRRNR
jgi:hypothetical protein